MEIFDELTIGIEEEYQIIDTESRELTSFISEFMEQGAILFQENVKPEFLQSQIEVGSSVCKNIKEARSEICRLRNLVSNIAAKNKCKIIAAGTHPFSKWEEQLVTNNERYMGKKAIATFGELSRIEARITSPQPILSGSIL